MNYRYLGRTGVKVSPVCLGTMNFGDRTNEADSIRLTHAALDAGINFIDTSNSYNEGRSEEYVGRALAGGKRANVVLATKARTHLGPDINYGGTSRRHLLQAVEDSLRRLQTDYIDLYQLHRPEPDIAIDETLGALDDLVRAGKVRYIGTSTFAAWMLMEALATSERLRLARFVSEQPPYNLLDRRMENELVPFALKYNLALIPWAPLAQGLLAGRYQPGQALPDDSRAAAQPGSGFSRRITARSMAAGAAFTALAQQHGRTPAQLGLLWCKDQPGVTAPIYGPRTLEQLNDVLPVLELTLSAEERAACDALNPPGGALANFHNTSGWLKTPVD
jgi:aryl-alcohol dehydrogenase-like predicted oxidoreductase